MQLIISLIIINLIYSYSKELPSFIPICRRTQPKYNQCILNATVELQPYLTKGIKELNVPTLDPLVIPKVKLNQGTKAVNYEAVLTNLKINGLRNYKFNRLTADFSNQFKMEGSLELPYLALISDYTIAGKVLVVPINGKGVFTANITKCVADVKVIGHVTKKKSGEFVEVKETSMKLNFGVAESNLENLYQGNSLLSATTQTFLRENSDEVLKELKPAIEEVASSILKDIAGNFLRSLPFEKLFPL